MADPAIFTQIRDKFGATDSSDVGRSVAKDAWRDAATNGASLAAVLGEDGASDLAHTARTSSGATLLEIDCDDVEALRNVPWELMHVGDRYLLADAPVDLVRLANTSDPKPVVAQTPGARFRILFVVGPSSYSGSDAGVAPVKELKRIFRGVPGVDVAEAEDDVSVADLSEDLRANPVDLLIFHGHATHDGLYLNSGSGNRNGWADTKDLTSHWAGKVRAALLLACDAASGARVNLARDLAAAGIHTVAFQSPMHPARADDFLVGFLGALATRNPSGVTLPQAVRAGRESLSRSNLLEGAYARPVLWQPTGEPLRLMDAVGGTAIGAGLLFGDIAGNLFVPTPDLDLEPVDGIADATADGAFDGSESVLATVDGRLIARQDGDVLEFAVVDRSTCRVTRRPTPITLPAAGEGKVLAVGGSGEGVLFVWAGADNVTRLCRATADGRVRQIRKFGRAQARHAVLSGREVMVTFAGSTTLGVDKGQVERLVGARSGGRTVVLAVGTHSRGEADTWVEIAGRACGWLGVAGAALVRPARIDQQPYVLVDDYRIDLAGLPRSAPDPEFPSPRWRRLDWT